MTLGEFLKNKKTNTKRTCRKIKNRLSFTSKMGIKFIKTKFKKWTKNV